MRRDRCCVLEVGSGIGAVTVRLGTQGHEAVAIEPAGTESEEMRLRRRGIDAAVAMLQPWFSIERCGAAADRCGRTRFCDARSPWRGFRRERPRARLRPSRRTRLDAGCLHGGAASRLPDVPVLYESHVFVPFPPFAPSLAGGLLSRRITEPGLGQLRNSVTSRRIRRWARRAGLDGRFDDGVVAAGIARFLRARSLVCAMMVVAASIDCRGRSPG